MLSRRIGRTMNDARFKDISHWAISDLLSDWSLPGAARKARRNEGCARAALSKKNLCNVSLAMCFMYSFVAQPEAT